MKLIRQLEKLEAQRGELRGQAVGLVWSDGDQVDELAAGEAVDVVDRGELNGVRLWRLVLRPARGAGDLGDYVSEEGRRLGRVVRLSGSLVEVVEDAEGEGVAAEAAPRSRTRKRAR